MDFFIKAQYQDELENNGYVIIPLLDTSQVNELLILFENVRKDSGINSEFYTSIWSDNRDHRRQVDEGLKKVLFPALQKFMHDIQPVFANFMIKAPGENSSLNPHQDWSFVDEPKYESLTAWIPLVDVDHSNGNLQVVPGSHRDLQNYIRPRFGNYPFERSEASARLVGVPMKAGEALIINSRLIHASPPNQGDKVRIAVSLVVAPQQASLKHWLLQESSVKEFTVDQSFFWRYSCFDRLETLVS